MREIKLTRGKVALVSDHRYESLARHKWCAAWNRKRDKYTAVRAIVVDGQKKILLMHREILGLGFGDRRKADHIKVGDTLNNQDDNLRIATNAQNMWNSGKRKNNKSGFKGVWWSKVSSKWTAQIRVGEKKIHLGLFDTAESAHAAYCDAALKYHGEFARLN
jgi:AP2 domain